MFSIAPVPGSQAPDPGGRCVSGLCSHAWLPIAVFSRGGHAPDDAAHALFASGGIVQEQVQAVNLTLSFSELIFTKLWKTMNNTLSFFY